MNINNNNKQHKTKTKHKQSNNHKQNNEHDTTKRNAIHIHRKQNHKHKQ